MQRRPDDTHDAQDERLVGQRLDHFEVIELIGRGGMGLVFRARDTSLDRPVALKVLPAELMRAPGRRAGLAREARLAARVSCAEVATLYEARLDTPRPYLVMELVRGRTLREVMSDGVVEARAMLETAQGIARGMAHLHTEGVLHGDLKPENVMVTPEGRIKLLDLGIARALALDVTCDTRAGDHPGSREGTPGYMSPEQLAGRLLDARADVYAFGAILMELLGRRAALPEIEALASACLAPDPRDRPADGAALVEALATLARSAADWGTDPALRLPEAWATASPDARTLLRDATALAWAQGAGFLGLEHLMAALRRHGAAGPRTRRLCALLSQTEDGWTQTMVAPTTASPVLTPRLLAWSEHLPLRSDIERLVALICADPDHHLHIAAGLDLGAARSSDGDPWSTVSSVAWSVSAPGPVQALEVLRGPEDGRILPLEAGHTVGRWAPGDTAHHALYQHTAVQDPTLSRMALHWIGDDRAVFSRPWRLLRAGERHSHAAGESAIAPGDVLQLTPGTWLRVLERDRLLVRS